MSLHLMIHDVADLAPARRALRSWLVDHEAADIADRAALVLSELVTNALVHTDTGPGKLPTQVDCACSEATVRVSVCDHGPATPMTRERAFDDVGNWGLSIVDAVSERWGVIPHPDGKSVWAELAR